MFDAYIRDHARLQPRAPAVITPDRRVSYADFNADIDRLGWALGDLGVHRAAGVVSVRIANAYLNAVAIAALSRLGVASSPGNDPGAGIRLVDREAAGGGSRAVHLDAGLVSAALKAPHRPLPRIAPEPDATVRVGLTSALLEKPRRARFTAQRVAASIDAQAYSFGRDRPGGWITMQGADSSAGFIRPVTAWRLGACVVDGFPIRALAEQLESLWKPGVLSAAPGQLNALLGALPPGFKPQSQWRIVMGGPSPSSVFVRAVLERLSPDAVICYGSAEASVNCIGPLGHDAQAGDVGFPLAGCEIEILGADGESGELRIRSNRMASGYLDDAPASVFRDGWFHPGDIGRYLPDGRLLVEGHVDDRMSLGNVKARPQAVESRVAAYPGVIECAAFPVPGANALNQCWVAIVATADCDRPALTARLTAHEGLPPLRLAWIEEIPRRADGAPDRVALQQAVLAEMARARP